MITRFASFDGRSKPEGIASFRTARIERPVPSRRLVVCATAMHAMFGKAYDLRAPDSPLIPATPYPGRDVVVLAPNGPFHVGSRDVTSEIGATSPDGRILYHLPELTEHSAT